MSSLPRPVFSAASFLRSALPMASSRACRSIPASAARYCSNSLSRSAVSIDPAALTEFAFARHLRDLMTCCGDIFFACFSLGACSVYQFRAVQQELSAVERMIQH